MKKNIGSFILLTMCLISCGGNVQYIWEPDTYSVEMSSETSAFNGKTYIYGVVLPSDYGVSEETYPVLYTLDGEEFLYRFGKILEEEKRRVILVAIYNMGDVNRSEDNGMPGVSSFSKFILEELTPVIEEKYNINAENRTLLGQSWTGVGVSFVAFLEDYENRYFQTYISCDGAYIDSVYSSFDTLADNLKKNTDTLGFSLFILSAPYGMYRLGELFYDHISQYEFNKYSVVYRRIDGTYHGWSIVEPVFRDHIERYDVVNE